MPCHGKRFAVAGHDFIGEIHQASALGVDGSPFIRELLYRGNHFLIRAELIGVELGIPAAEVEGVEPRGECGVLRGLNSTISAPAARSASRLSS